MGGNLKIVAICWSKYDEVARGWWEWWENWRYAYWRHADVTRISEEFDWSKQTLLKMKAFCEVDEENLTCKKGYGNYCQNSKETQKAMYKNTKI